MEGGSLIKKKLKNVAENKTEKLESFKKWRYHEIITVKRSNKTTTKKFKKGIGEKFTSQNDTKNQQSTSGHVIRFIR